MSEDKPDNKLFGTLSQRLAESLRTGARMENADITLAKVETKPRRGYCAHKATVLDATLRTIACKDCKAQLDPLTVLLDLSSDRERHIAQIAHYKKAANDLSAQFDELKKEERRIKQRIASAKKRAEKYPPLAAVKLTGVLMQCTSALRLHLSRKGAETPKLPRYVQDLLEEAQRLCKAANVEELKL